MHFSEKYFGLKLNKSYKFERDSGLCRTYFHINQHKANTKISRCYRVETEKKYF